MGDEQMDRRGTISDWPAKVLLTGVALLVLGVVVLVVIGASGALLVLPAVPLILVGGLSLMIRRGAFTPRSR